LFGFWYPDLPAAPSLVAFLVRLTWFMALALNIWVFVRSPRQREVGYGIATAPGWYPDASDPSRNNYWDGTAWQGMPVLDQPKHPEIAPVSVTTSTYAIVSLVSAFFMPLLAVIFGHLAKQEIRRSRGLKVGDGLSTAGLVLGYLGIVGALIYGYLYWKALHQAVPAADYSGFTGVDCISLEHLGLTSSPAYINNCY